MFVFSSKQIHCLRVEPNLSFSSMSNKYIMNMGRRFDIDNKKNYMSINVRVCLSGKGKKQKHYSATALYEWHTRLSSSAYLEGLVLFCLAS